MTDATTARDATVLDSLCARLRFPVCCCVIGPRGSGKTALATGLAVHFNGSYPHTSIYVISNSIHEYHTLTRLFNVAVDGDGGDGAASHHQIMLGQDASHRPGVHFVDAGTMNIRSKLFSRASTSRMPTISANAECLLLIDAGFLNHREQVFLHEWISVHPAASIVLVEYLWPEAVLEGVLQMCCEWDRRGAHSGFHIYHVDDDVMAQQHAADNTLDSPDNYYLYGTLSRQRWNAGVNVLHQNGQVVWVTLEDILVCGWKMCQHWDVSMSEKCILL
jgi:hypothetical protein